MSDWGTPRDLVVDGTALLLFPDNPQVGDLIHTRGTAGARVILPVLELTIARANHRIPELLELLVQPDYAEIAEVRANQWQPLAGLMRHAATHNIGRAQSAFVAIARSAQLLTYEPRRYSQLPIDLIAP